jgi:tetratricopeptide repeat protein
MVQRLNHTFDRALTLVGLVVVLAGCVSEQQTPYPRTPTPVPPSTQTRPPQQYPAPTQPAPQPTPQSPAPVQPQPQQPKPQSTVTLALQDEAQRAATAGDLPKAIQILERAIRIQPDSAQLWIELARCHLKEGNAAQAEQFARKALLFTGNRYDLEQQAWVVIADARAEKH